MVSFQIRDLSRSGQLKPADLQKLTQTSGDKAAQIDAISMMIKRNQLSTREYIQVLNREVNSLTKNIQLATQTGEKKRQQILGVKRDIVAKEVCILL